MHHARNLGHAAQPRQRAGKHHHQHDIFGDVDARVFCRAGVISDEADFVSPAAVIQYQPKHKRGENANQQPRVSRQPSKGGDFLAVIGEPRQPCRFGEFRAHLKAAFAPHAEDEKVDPRNRNVVQHEGADDFVDVEFRFEIAGDKSPHRAESHPEERHRKEENPAGRIRRKDRGEDDRARAERAHDELSLRADIPQFHAERQRAG